MSSARRKKATVADGKALYRQLIGPLADDTAVDEFAAMDDTRTNRFRLAHIAQQGGDRGRAARERLAEWEASDSSDGDPLVDRGISSGRPRGTDPFNGPTAA
ncbi:hypothetical protein ACIQ8D_15220 [Streptomyces sp. NPDC096094]|uniref:hypothetical protein n=1 Tax=Streptomyces sp. NPDC096094 TaxID=3366073 RepID=UPI0037F76607